MALEIIRIPVLSDNYVWLVHEPVSGETMVVDPAVTHLEVEVTGNTVQAVTCEAFITELAGL